MSTTPNHDMLDDPNNNGANMSLFRGCTETCGWVAAVVAVLAFGSFGVPLKATKTQAGVEVHPLVMQSYKTATCFATCWLVLLAGEELRWSHWGIASGLFWVPGSTCGIFSIRNAGLAVAVGTWSSICVLTSFIFGILIFQEGVKNIGYTACAFALLMVGLIGMAQYSAVSSAAATTSSSSSGKQPSASVVPVHKTTNTAAAAMIPNMVPPVRHPNPLLRHEPRKIDHRRPFGAATAPSNVPTVANYWIGAAARTPPKWWNAPTVPKGQRRRCSRSNSNLSSIQQWTTKTPSCIICTKTIPEKSTTITSFTSRQ